MAILDGMISKEFQDLILQNRVMLVGKLGVKDGKEVREVLQYSDAKDYVIGIVRQRGQMRLPSPSSDLDRVQEEAGEEGYGCLPCGEGVDGV